MCRFNLITSLFFVSATLVFITPQLKAQDGLIAHWTFDEGKGDKAKDSSPNAHDATLEGNPKWTAKGACLLYTSPSPRDRG